MGENVTFLQRTKKGQECAIGGDNEELLFKSVPKSPMNQ